MRGYLRTLLEVDSHRVETGVNGNEALERVQREPVPDVVLLDLLMPVSTAWRPWSGCATSGPT